MEIDDQVTSENTAGVRDAERHDDQTVELPVDGEATLNEYAYTMRDNFTSEIFKIEVTNLPFHMSPKDFKKLLTGRLRLEPHKIKMFNIRRSRFAFVTFKNEKLRDEGIKLLDGYKYKQVTLRAGLAKPKADPVERAKKRENLTTTELTQGNLSVLDVVIPWHAVPYDEQLKRKQSAMVELFTKFERDLGRQQTAEFNEFVRTLKRCSNRETICEIHDICRSPREDFYRNKNEFTPGRDDDGKIVVGFRKACYKKGSTVVGGVDDEMKHIPRLAIKVARLFENYFEGCAGSRPPYNAHDEQGFWRQLTVRTTETNQCMVIVLMHPQKLTEEEIQSEISKLSEFYITSLKDVVSSFYFQRFDKKSNVYPLELIGGSKVIEENLLGLRFEISPPSFFQVNTIAAEVLYKKIHELAQLTPDSTVLDLFCGTGSIGLSIAANVKKVLGAEIVVEAVENARRVASEHSIENCEFLAGKAEDVLSLALHKVSDEKNVVAILDPPRQGVHKRVIKLIRACNNIACVVFVACNPTAAMPNIIDFCKQSSNNYRGEPFFPVAAQPVDMFPHTPHTELVVTLRRYKEVQLFQEKPTLASSAS